MRLTLYLNDQQLYIHDLDKTDGEITIKTSMTLSQHSIAWPKPHVIELTDSDDQDRVFIANKVSAFEYSNLKSGEPSPIDITFFELEDID